MVFNVELKQMIHVEGRVKRIGTIIHFYDFARLKKFGLHQYRAVKVY